MLDNLKNKWFVGGLHFECQQCGRCCSGPEEGYIWVTKDEIALISDYLKITEKQFQSKYLKKQGLRTTIIEKPVTRDCIFLNSDPAKPGCAIYPVRPNQCRTWPFWDSNLKSPATWNQAASVCPGINRGKFYSFEEIEKRRKQKKWWTSD